MDKFGNTLIAYNLQSKQDTLMACFTVFLYGRESQKDRLELRKKLLEKCTKNIEFVQKNADKEGFISNKDTFINLFVELYQVNVYYNNELYGNGLYKHNLYLTGNFQLLV